MVFSFYIRLYFVLGFIIMCLINRNKKTIIQFNLLFIYIYYDKIFIHNYGGLFITDFLMVINKISYSNLLPCFYSFIVILPCYYILF